ncbi:UDP-glucose 4-epimerase GalE [Pelagicoccus sp. SDUM812002]|uniref:UDP-glucose 4-epimerase GalE n=1 Tax=Pelagicoccus sp. SDUM812002 TaxID=3041266 RepID=UPI00280EECE7|nr:UDP-glucose 4-epimerase GalE [Pelagicoccus sp. SDUM812002]
MNVLVVGGAGYIGSHCVRLLEKTGHTPIVFDNLRRGHADALPDTVTVIEGDLGDYGLVHDVLIREEIEIVMHFAAYAYVGESMQDPLLYFENNTAKSIALLRAMKDAGVRKIVFSSSCTIFGDSSPSPLSESASPYPISAYGHTKAGFESLLDYCSKAYGFSAAIFRYFNASGAASSGEIGEDHSPETHLIPIAIQCALGQRKSLAIFGNDYDTPDGTCLRDYVHVDDISAAHVLAFPKLQEAGKIHIYNLGTEKPTSVLQIVTAVEKASARKVHYHIEPRRDGDVPAAYADSSKARNELGWQPQFPDIDSIVATAWRWHSRHPRGYRSDPDEAP